MKVPIYYNGELVGYHENPEKFVKEFRKKRRVGEIPWDLTVTYYQEENEIHINGDEGRVLRPLIVVENGKPKLTEEHIKKLKEGTLTFFDLVKQGVIELLDAEEEENAYIAVNESELTEEHTHLELHPALIFGLSGSHLPFPEYNSVPRITMAVQMIKQSLGMFAYNYRLRMDTETHVMYYPQKPIVKTKFMDVFKTWKKPAGQNMIVAVMSYEGYNINDAIIMNKTSIERGLARTVMFRTLSTEERRYPGGQMDRIEVPKIGIQGYRGEEAYQYLDEDGIINLEQEVKEGDVLIGKTSPPRFLEEISELSLMEEKRRESSLAVPKGKYGTVDKVIITEGEGGSRLVKVRLRRIMPPEIGDKFASRHGQKGVIGLILDQRDMPFSENGIVPDLIMNPHAIPSRMTVGHILDTLGGKAGSLAARHIDATPFDGEDEEAIKKVLIDYGFKPSGKEVLYDGITGEKIETEIFVGVTYYQRLKHLVANKIHARARGPVQILTRQPTEGKAREGGLRLGEMERDCLIGYGASLLLMERLLEESDKVTVWICEKCGVLAIEDHIKNRRYCPLCGETKVAPVDVSYAFTLLLNEIISMGIIPRLRLKDRV